MGLTKKTYLKRKNQRHIYESRKRAAKLINKRFIIKKKNRHKEGQQGEAQTISYEKIRRQARRKIFKDYDFNNQQSLPVVIDKTLGIEFGDIDSFIGIGKQIVESSANDVRFYLTNCEKLWPSAIMLLCSFLEWRTLAFKYSQKKHKSSTRPKQGSYGPRNKELADYLCQSGFYDYVHVDYHKPIPINPDEIVKLELNNCRTVIDKKMQELEDLITRKAQLTDSEKEAVNCKVIPEIINNATEHGENCIDQSWWTMGQYVPDLHIISICIADNGIGFKETLCTGPQSDDSIIKDLIEKDASETQFIELAFKDGISGAMDANNWELSHIHEYLPNGRNRGGGMSGIKDTCKQCGIKLSIFSQSGYIIYDENGNISSKNSFDKRIFGGTFFNLVIPGI